LKEIREEVEKLAQGIDLTDAPQWRQTEAGRVAEWQESRNIDNDPEAKEKWLKMEQARADENWRKRERRLTRQRDRGALKLSVPNGNGGRNEPIAAGENVSDSPGIGL